MEIFLKRPHFQVPWGFRIIGGSDSHLPIIVSKVLEQSVAEEAGLQEDLILERINNVPTSGLSHAEVNQLILAAENELLLTIKRVNLETLILATLNDEESDSEISNILRQIINKDVTVESDKSSRKDQELEEMGLKREFETIVEPDKHRTINQNHRHFSVQPPGKKWSTFLQKPKNPTPREKNQAPPVSKENRYKVVITKQPKKEKPPPQITIDIPEEDNEQKEIKEEEEKHVSSFEAEQSSERQTDDFQEPIEGQEFESNEIVEENLEEIYDNNNEELRETEEENEEKQVLENESICEDVITEAPSLEEQLAAVQKQLQELAQLPSTIQDTLSAVTQQLATIVGSKVHENEAKDEETHEKECFETDHEPQEEEKELEDLEHGENVVEAMDEVSESAEMEGPQSEILSDICEEQELSEIIEEGDTETPATETIIEDDKSESNSQKKQLEEQLREEEEIAREKNYVRPIILPGGRKWVDPDDAVVKVKNPKMTDDRICNTIETFSEVIVGKVKGINFLKYTPPPKNLEYLQRSEVYRLIHGMEPPMRGISQRSEKILAEQDYYTPGGN